MSTSDAWDRFSGVPRSELEQKVVQLEKELEQSRVEALHWRIRAEVSEGLISMIATDAERS